MRKGIFLLTMGVVLVWAITAFAADNRGFETDRIKTAGGELAITFIGHGTLMMTFGGKVVHVDPVSEYADYGKLPKADLILVTHEHRDHLDLKAMGLIRGAKTAVAVSENVARQVQGGIVLKNGEVKTIQGFRIEAVPAYNLVHMRSPGVPHHPKGVGNGYII